jgi:hypothetical protein
VGNDEKSVFSAHRPEDAEPGRLVPRGANLAESGQPASVASVYQGVTAWLKKY